MKTQLHSKFETIAQRRKISLAIVCVPLGNGEKRAEKWRKRIEMKRKECVYCVIIFSNMLYVLPTKIN